LFLAEKRYGGCLQRVKSVFLERTLFFFLAMAAARPDRFQALRCTLASTMPQNPKTPNSQLTA
jgi:hypothetical protein